MVPWGFLEDSVYSDKLIIAQSINESYLKEPQVLKFSNPDFMHKEKSLTWSRDQSNTQMFTASGDHA